MTDFITKDSGAREHFDSGMQRDSEAGKARFDLTIPEGVPYEEQLLTRFAQLLGRGAEKYEERNWEKADSEAEVKRAKSSAFRHFIQWFTGELDEDHAAAVLFNIMVVETISWKIRQAPDGGEFVERGERLRDALGSGEIAPLAEDCEIEWGTPALPTIVSKSEAFDNLLAGDLAEYDSAIRESVCKLADLCEIPATMIYPDNFDTTPLSFINALYNGGLDYVRPARFIVEVDGEATDRRA